MEQCWNKALRQWGRRLAALTVILIGVMLLLSAGPTHGVTTTSSDEEAMRPVSKIDKAFSISEASAHKGSRKHNIRHRLKRLEQRDTSRLVFAHYMVAFPSISNTVEGYKEEIQTAQAAGIDGFALNAGGWSEEPRYIDNADKMYEAAEELGTNFKLFFSADMCCITKPSDIHDMVTRYYDHPNQYKVRGKPFLSTFIGQWQYFGYSSAAEGWQKAVLQPLADAGKPVYFVPNFYDKLYPDPPGTDKTHPSLEAIKSIYAEFPFVNGLFYFSGFARGSEGVTPAVESNKWFTQEAKRRGKVFMAHVSPNFSPHLNRINMIAGDVAGGEGIQQFWKGVISDQPQFVEMVTWNDFGEDTYIGPCRNLYGGELDPYAMDFPHLAYLELSKHYIQWYKTGHEPTITKDKLFYFYRTHSKDAVATRDPLPKPPGWDTVEDKIYATAMLTQPATVQITSGETTKSFDLPAGISNVSIPFEEGDQKVKAVRDGVMITESVGDLPVDNSISKYNFNYYSNFVEAV